MMLDVKRRALNAARLLLTNPQLRPKFAAIIRDLEGHGWQPLIDGAVWRSPAKQAELKRKGYSKVSWSFHNATTPSGRPDALAVDITDARHGWNSPTTFWLQLAASAESHGLTTGIYWGLNHHERADIHRAIEKRTWAAYLVLGWDTAHVQPRDLSIVDARQGKRPS